MKGFLFLSMLIFIAVMIYVSVYKKEDAGDEAHANEGIPR